MIAYREVIEQLYVALLDGVMPQGFDVAEIEDWNESQRIGLVFVPEIAQIIGCKPSDIDPYFIGKDDIEIDWS